ncbi:MAG: hypothetical protein H6709_01060 [Kofleriaceae bacterium]|nr:hypothetical protein [Kofleriaceae bacterium]MCB9570657.1 hypothetical protein [Kofleriaceae bacterium]
MRGTASLTSIGAALLGAALLLGAGCDGCKDKAASKPAPAAQRDDRGRGAGPPSGRRPHMPRGKIDPRQIIRHNAPLTVEDARTALPLVDGGRELAPPALAPSGTQVRFTACIEAPSLVEAGDKAKASLEAGGWTKITARGADQAAASARYGIAAEKDDLRLSVTVQAVRRTGCDESLHEYFTVSMMSRLADADAAAGGAPPTAPAAPPPENE